MAFNDTQIKSLKAKLKRQHVKTRAVGGNTLSYIEGWHAIAEANRIFHFENWDRQTGTPQCHWTKQVQGELVCFYSTKVRITVRAGESVIVREGIGTGTGRSPHADIAHDLAIKSAETDATKRALATFGNPFGLPLYDPQQRNVSKEGQPFGRKGPRRGSQQRSLINVSNQESQRAEDGFMAETLAHIDDLNSLKNIYAFWEANLETFEKLRTTSSRGNELVMRIAESLKARARAVGITTDDNRSDTPPASYLLPKEKRLRDRAHLAFVASHPCLICGRQPSQAHHLRFAQPRAFGLKVSDEFTVPLCVTHHSQLHQNGDERAFWARNGVSDPLAHAEALWTASRRQRDAREPSQVIDPDTEPEFNEPAWRKGSHRKNSQ